MKKMGNIVWNFSKDPAANARTVLPPIAQEFFAAGRRALKKTQKLRSLHKFRIKAKSFRYSLEIFQPLYGPALESRLERLKQMQQYLGSINDCVSIRQLLDGALQGEGFLATQFNQSLDARERQKVHKLVEYWKESFDAPGEEEKWTRYLRDYAGRPRRSARQGTPASPSGHSV